LSLIFVEGKKGGGNREGKLQFNIVSSVSAMAGRKKEGKEGGERIEPRCPFGVDFVWVKGKEGKK